METGANSSTLGVLDYMRRLRNLHNTGMVENLKILRFSQFTGTLDDLDILFGMSAIGLVYLVFFIFMLIVFVKKDMLGMLQIVLTLANFVEIVPWVLSLPLYIMFSTFSKSTTPIPYPWCIIFVLLQESAPLSVHLTAICLKILLAINRLCSISYPFKMAVWFSKCRTIIYCSIICTICALFGTLMNFKVFEIEKQNVVSDIWEIEKYEMYTACRMNPDNVIVGEQLILSTHFILDIIEYAVLLMTTILLFALNIGIIFKIKRVERHRAKLTEMPHKLLKRNGKRVNLLNKITVWVLATAIVIELPLLVMKSIGFYDIILMATSHSASPIFEDSASIQWWTLGYMILLPLDLIIFTFLSKKARSGIRDMLC